jgi:hypothetical protein
VLNLSVVPESLRERAREAVDKGDGLEFVCLVNNQHALALVFDNIHALRERGCYEQALVHAFTGCRVNHSHWPDEAIKFLFQLADKPKLRAAGDSLPEDAVTVFRGVSGRGPRRRLHRFSWTGCLDTACWFALRLHLPNPAVLTATVQPDEILCCLNDRSEQEFIARPGTISRMKMSQDEMRRRADARKTATAS